MKLRFWLGIILVAFAAGLFAYRGVIVGYVMEKWEKRALPEAIQYVQIPRAPHLGARSDEPPPESESQSPASLVLGPHESEVINEEAASDPAGLLGEVPAGSSLPTLLLTRDAGDDEIRLPVEFNLAVPFTSQAPFEVWDDVHKEACEEAAVMMVDAFYDGRMFTRQSAEDEIQEIVAWQNQTFGYFKDTTAEETARILREKYGYANVRVVYDPTIDDVKYEVAQGQPVILPAAGRLLGNRYFRQPGPLYHMLLVRGWTKDGMIITNDPGTKRGEQYLYDPAILMNAVHDWNGGDVEHGRKVMIVVENN